MQPEPDHPRYAVLYLTEEGRWQILSTVREPLDAELLYRLVRGGRARRLLQVRLFTLADSAEE